MNAPRYSFPGPPAALDGVAGVIAAVAGQKGLKPPKNPPKRPQSRYPL
jgi:hypothetical protein